MAVVLKVTVTVDTDKSQGKARTFTFSCPDDVITNIPCLNDDKLTEMLAANGIEASREDINSLYSFEWSDGDYYIPIRIDGTADVPQE